MPLDPLAVPLASPITHVRPRWEVGQAPNPLGGIPSVKFLGFKVYCTADGVDVGQPWRDASLDYEVQFDPANPAHVAAFSNLDAVVKATHVAALAKLAEQED